MPHPLHMLYGNLAQLGKKSNSVIRSRSVMVKNWCNVLSMEGVTVCGHHPECRVTFGRGGPHIVWWDPRTDHRTSLEKISNVPWHIPAQEVYWKVASPSEQNIHKRSKPWRIGVWRIHLWYQQLLGTSGGTMFYKIISFLVDYIVKKWHFCPKISKIRQYIEVILSETNDG